MKVKNKTIFMSREPMQVLSKVKLPVRASYQLVKLIRVLDEQLIIIDKVLQDLRQNYGEKDEKGQVTVKVDSSNYLKFIEEVNELMAQDAELHFEKVKLPDRVPSTCDACHHNMDRLFEIEASILVALDTFIEIS